MMLPSDVYLAVRSIMVKHTFVYKNGYFYERMTFIYIIVPYMYGTFTVSWLDVVCMHDDM